ncbi:FG-GAP-like repeat-containing protein [Mucilaginibacter hurinus]|nr:FG-GAP-like repeat-containing protein [Mucilaginibacter hurinus]
MNFNALLLLLLALATTVGVFAQPKVTTLTPSRGPVGTQITISGDGFSAISDSNTVFFGPVRASINSANSTRLLVTVPAGAKFGPVNIINKQTRLSCMSDKDFELTFSPEPTSLASKVRLPGITGVADLQLNDMDGDGKADLLATSPTARQLIVLRNKTKTGEIDTGSFAAPIKYTTGPQPGIVAINDLDGDGKRDVILMNTGYSTVANANNSLSFFQNVSTPGHIKLFNIVITDSTEKAPASYNFQLKPGDKVTRFHDVDGDGKPDMLVLNSAGYLSIYRNVYIAGKPFKTMFGAPVAIPFDFEPSSFNIGDMDGDGKPDIVAASPSTSALALLRNNALKGVITASSFQYVSVTLNFMPVNFSLCDMDKDGKTDVLISKTGGKAPVLIHNTSTTGKFSGIPISLNSINLVSDYYNNFVLPDASGDARPDLVTYNTDFSAVSLYNNKAGPGQINKDYFKDEVTCPVSTLPDWIGDLDGDGLPEIMIGSAFGIDIYRTEASASLLTINKLPVNKVIKDEIAIYPNPASIYTNLKYTLPFNSNATVIIYDDHGKALKSFETGQKTAGSHVMALELAGLTKGVYVIIISAGEYARAGKLIIE